MLLVLTTTVRALPGQLRDLQALCDLQHPTAMAGRSTKCLVWFGLSYKMHLLRMWLYSSLKVLRCGGPPDFYKARSYKRWPAPCSWWVAITYFHILALKCVVPQHMLC